MQEGSEKLFKAEIQLQEANAEKKKLIIANKEASEKLV